MIAIKERRSPPTWSGDGEQAVVGRSRPVTRRRGPLVVDVCGVLVFVALMAAYVFWA